MSTHILESTHVRKPSDLPVEYPGAHCVSIGSVETLLDRIRLVMQMKGWNESQWAKLAELKERSNVNKLIKRLEANPGEIVGDLKTFAKLAKAAGVSLDWLVLGRGSADLVTFTVVDDPKYPTRPNVIFAGYILRMPQAAIDAVQAVDAGPTDPGRDYWLHLLLAKRAEFAEPQTHQLGR